MALTIVGNLAKAVRVAPPTPDGRSQIPNEKIAVTDATIGLLPGTEIDRGDSGYFVSKYSPAVPLLGGQAPEVGRNPYNFVELPKSGPWLEAPAPGCRHAGHDEWYPSLLTGRVRFTLTARTPVFVPEGQQARGAQDAVPFFSLRKEGETKARFAIHGASLKGMLRSGVEALANDRFGMFDAKTLGTKISYRRRVYAGPGAHPPVNATTGILVQEVSGVWLVLEMAVDYLNAHDLAWGDTPPADLAVGKFKYQVQEVDHRKMAVPGDDFTPYSIRPFRGNLLWTGNTKHNRYTHIILRTIPQTNTYQLAKNTTLDYQTNIDGPHYANHYDAALVAIGDPQSKYNAPMPPLEDVKKDLKRIEKGELIYFTWNQFGTPPIKRITSFGKNVNYLWPAIHTVKDLAGSFVRDEDANFSLGSDLGMAERIFGFSAPHKGKASHPFRGKVMFETLWGPPTSSPTEQIQLAPLTSPGTRAKARPLYLEGRNNGSASYTDQPAPRLMGRKFYWHQRADDSPEHSEYGLWKIHRWKAPQPGPQHALAHQAGQGAPPMQALPKETVFEGYLHFENLSREELGALMYALAGPPEGSLEHYDHCLKIGKGKPRGMGSMKPEIKVVEFVNREYYDTLDADADPYLPGDLRDCILAFREWCKKRSGKDQFDQIDHVRDYVRLHTWPASPSLRLYPVNFKDYGWLPRDNKNPDEPRGGTRPPALPRARTLEP